MALRTLTARYAGRCRGCGGDLSVGDTIRHGGRGLTFHNRDSCSGVDRSGRDPEHDYDDDGAEGYDDTYAPYRSDRDARVVIFRNGDGTVVGTRNRNGLCEDAPCCGCCS